MRIYFRFRIQNLLRLDQIGTFSIGIHQLHLLKNDETNPVTKQSNESGKVCNIIV